MGWSTVCLDCWEAVCLRCYQQTRAADLPVCMHCRDEYATDAHLRAVIDALALGLTPADVRDLPRYQDSRSRQVCDELDAGYCALERGLGVSALGIPIGA